MKILRKLKVRDARLTQEELDYSGKSRTIGADFVHAIMTLESVTSELGKLQKKYPDLFKADSNMVKQSSLAKQALAVLNKV